MAACLYSLSRVTLYVSFSTKTTKDVKNVFYDKILFPFIKSLISICGGTGTEVTVPTNTVHVPITTGTVTDSGSGCTGFIG